MGRRKFLIGGAAVAGLAVAGAAAPKEALKLGSGPAQPKASSTALQATGTTYTFHSAPALNGAPRLNIQSATGLALGEYIFLTPINGAARGPAIFDSLGHLVWFRPTSATQVHNLQVVHYQGRDLLAWYEGETPASSPGSGQGDYILADSTYGEVQRIRGGSGQPIDLHDLVITPQGTALVEAYTPVQRDLSASGGTPNTMVLDWLLQEVDIASGNVLFSWGALDHVPIEESVVALPTEDGSTYDYFHGNSIDVGADGNLLVSARNVSTLYKLDRKSGDIIWRLRGATPAVAGSPALALQPEGESFWFQHDARWNRDGTLSVFDDGGAPFHHNARGLVLQVDETAGTATIGSSYTVGIEVGYEGSNRHQVNGDWLVGWGSVGRFTEFSPSGDVQIDASFAGNSYRALRFRWNGEPSGSPAVAAQRTSGDSMSVWASWNGATAVKAWRVLTGDSDSTLRPAGTFWWQDFETEMPTNSSASLVAVDALDSSGKVLATSHPITVPARSG